MLKSASDLEGGQATVVVGRGFRPDARRMALGGRGHRLGAAVDDADRACRSPARRPRAAAAPKRRACRQSRRRRPSGGCGLFRPRRRARARSPRGPCRAPACRRRPPCDRRAAPHSRPPARCRRARRNDVSKRPSAVAAAAAWPAATSPHFRLPRDQDVVGGVRMERVAHRRERGVDAGERIELRPGDRQVGVGHAFDRLARADQRQHRLAAEAHMSRREDGLVAKMRKDAEGVFARHIVGGEDRDEAGRAGDDGVEIAEGEGRAAHEASARRASRANRRERNPRRRDRCRRLSRGRRCAGGESRRSRASLPSPRGRRCRRRRRMRGCGVKRKLVDVASPHPATPASLDLLKR